MAHALVEDVEHGVVLVEPDLKSGVGTEGDVAEDYAQAYRHEQQRLEVFLYCQPDEEGSGHNHYQVARRGVSEARVSQELVEVA